MGQGPDVGRDYELHFDGRGGAADYAFPCDAAGHVDLDRLDDTGRRDYLFAHTLIGRDYATRIVAPR